MILSGDFFCLFVIVFLLFGAYTIGKQPISSLSRYLPLRSSLQGKLGVHCLQGRHFSQIKSR